MVEDLINNRYIDGQYLNNTKTWHIEDSPYKAKIVEQSIRDNGIIFENCADVGCGAGLVVELLSEAFPESNFTGYELSKDVDTFWSTRTVRDNLKYSHNDVTDLVKKHDLVICLDVFEHIEDYFLFLRKLSRVGDMFIFNVPLDMCVAKLVTSGLKNARSEVGHLHYFNRFTAIETIRDAGYEIVSEDLCAAFLKIPPRNIRQAIALPFRLFSLVFGKSWSATILGGMSLLIVAKPLSKRAVSS
jgi:Methyltransferase domain